MFVKSAQTADRPKFVDALALHICVKSSEFKNVFVVKSPLKILKTIKGKLIMIKECFGEDKLCPFFDCKALNFVDLLN